MDEMTPAVARQILSLQFPDDVKTRTEILAAKARAGILTDDETKEIHAVEEANSVLDILKSKARLFLQDHGEDEE